MGVLFGALAVLAPITSLAFYGYVPGWTVDGSGAATNYRSMLAVIALVVIGMSRLMGRRTPRDSN
jgi:hypothetical protein